MDSLGGLEYEPDPPIRTSRITTLLSRDGRTAVLGAGRPSSGSRLTANVMTLTVLDLRPGEAVAAAVLDLGPAGAVLRSARLSRSGSVEGERSR